LVGACDLGVMTKRAAEAETLEAKVERVVREHLAVQQGAVKAALERAFGLPVMPRGGVRRRAQSRRRTKAEVNELAEQLYQAVKSCPGETMTVLAARVGEKPRALLRPMLHLKVRGRVRSAGERNFTRYFPLAAAKVA
jgi:hypothetical protein